MVMSFMFLCKSIIVEILKSILLYSTIIVAFTNNLLYNNTADDLQREHLKQHKPNLVRNTKKWTIDGKFQFLQHFLF